MDLSADFLHFGASDFPSENAFKKVLQNRLFFALASRTGFGATISDAVVRSSVVFCNSVSADHIVMAVSRLLRAVAAFVILLSFAARLGFGATISDAVVRSSIVFCNSVSADRLLEFFSDFACLQTPKLGKCNFCVLASRSGV